MILTTTKKAPRVVGTYLPHIEEGLRGLEEKQVELQKNEARYTESENELKTQVEIFQEVGDIVLEEEGKRFVIDEQNVGFVRYLIAYLNRWEETFRKCAVEMTGVEGDTDKPLFVMGQRGVGKTLHLQIASKFATVMRLKSREFINTSASELLNYMRVKGNLDYYTYNIGGVEMKAGTLGSARPWGVCLHDLGLELDASNKQRIYGTDLVAVLNDFLMARYELYQNCGLMCHVTTNLTVDQFTKNYPPRVRDRFKQYNYVTIKGVSRR